MAPLPKKKHSRSRTRRARAHMGKSRVLLVTCPACPAPHNLMKPHHACPKCGFYKDNYYLDTGTVEKKAIDFISK